jgi:hypothetical protein
MSVRRQTREVTLWAYAIGCNKYMTCHTCQKWFWVHRKCRLCEDAKNKRALGKTGEKIKVGSG